MSSTTSFPTCPRTTCTGSVALVEQGTTPQQRVYIATLDTLLDVIASKDIKPPTLIIVGEVVSLHEKLSWLEEHHVDNVDSVFAYKNQ